MQKTSPNISQIIKASGGVQIVSDATGAAKSTVWKWPANGIPIAYWDTIMDISGCTLDQLYAADRDVRANNGQPERIVA